MKTKRDTLLFGVREVETDHDSPLVLDPKNATGPGLLATEDAVAVHRFVKEVLGG